MMQSAIQLNVLPLPNKLTLVFCLPSKVKSVCHLAKLVGLNLGNPKEKSSLVIWRGAFLEDRMVRVAICRHRILIIVTLVCIAECVVVLEGSEVPVPFLWLVKILPVGGCHSRAVGPDIYPFVRRYQYSVDAIKVTQ